MAPAHRHRADFNLTTSAFGSRWVLFSGFIPSRDGFDFGFLIRRFVHSRRRSYYLFFNYLSYYLYVLPVYAGTKGAVLPVYAEMG